MTRALLLSAELFLAPRSSQVGPVAGQLLGNGETVLGRQIRLLARDGVDDFLIASPVVEEVRPETLRSAFSGLHFSFVAGPPWGPGELSSVANGDEPVLVVADDLVFSAGLPALLLDDPRPTLALYDGASRGGLDVTATTSLGTSAQLQSTGRSGLGVLARDGLLRAVATGLVGGGSRDFWPMLKLDPAAAAAWLGDLAELAGAGPGVGAATEALNRVAARQIPLLSIGGHFLAQLGQEADHRSILSQLRASDIERQRVVLEARGYVRLGDELARHRITRPLVVAGSRYDRLEVATHLQTLRTASVQFGDFSAVPTSEELLAAVERYREHGCDGVLSVGGAAAITVGKVVKLYAAEPERALGGPEPRFSSIPHVVLPTPDSAGSESNGSARVVLNGTPRRLDHDGLLPEVVILDTTAWEAADEADRRTAILGALGRCVVSVWSSADGEPGRRHALDALNLLLDALYGYLRGDDASVSQSLLRAVNLSGKASALTRSGMLGGLALPLASHLGIAPAQAAALCLPAVWRRLAARVSAASDIARAAKFREGCDVLAAALGAANDKEAAIRLERVVQLLLPAAPGAPQHEDVVELLAARATPDSLDEAPLPLSPTDLREVYRAALAQQARRAAGRPQATADSLDVLDQFADFCGARNLRYYLFGDTLRDAVTIGETTPWSGPVTVAMPRAQYDRLARWRDQLPASLWLDDHDSNPDRSGIAPRVVLTPGGRPPDPDLLPGITVRVLETSKVGWGPAHVADTYRQLLLHQLTRAAEGVPNEALTSALRAPIESLAKHLGVRRLAALRRRATNASKRLSGARTYVDFGLERGFAQSGFPAQWFGLDGRQRLGGRVYAAPVMAEAVLDRIYGSGFADVRTLPTARIASVPEPPERPAVDPAPPATSPRPSRDPWISIIVPVYNVEDYLAECLDSLCLQDTDGYEVIAVDDGSTDGSPQILRGYQSRFPDLLRVVRKPNGGLSDARNHGLQFARGEYVGFVDSDDFVAPDMIRRLGEKAASTGADIVVCNHAEYWAGAQRADVRWMSFINSYGHSVGERPELLVAAHPYAWNKIYRRRLFTEHGISYPVGQAFEDSATTFNLMLQANRIEYVDAPFYFYRMDRAGSITNTFNEKFYDIFKSFDSIRRFYTQHGRYDEFREEISELMRRTSFARLSALETCREPERVQQFLTAVYDYLERHAPGWADNKYFRRQMQNPKYRYDDKYRSMHSRTLMMGYLERLWQKGGDDLTAAEQHTTTELVRMLQLEELDILLRIDTFCAERGLTYYLAEGSLLGAVRHQGFVPWDDDIDIAMPRPDYERFQAALAAGEEPTLRLFSERTYPRYFLTFAKVLAAHPSGFTTTRVPLPAQFQGPCVDVFPLDRAPRQRDLRRERRIRWLRDLLLFKADYMSRRTKRRRYRSNLASRFFSYRYLQRTIQRLYRSGEADPDAVYLVNFASSYPVDREMVKASHYGNPVRVPFEGHLLPVPANWDAVLRTTYGAYMELPPMRQREPRHRPRWRDPSQL